MERHGSMLICLTCGERKRKISFFWKKVFGEKCKECRDTGKSINKRWSKEIPLEQMEAELGKVSQRTSNLDN